MTNRYGESEELQDALDTAMLDDSVSKGAVKAVAKQAYLRAWDKSIGADDFPRIRRKTAESNFEQWWQRNYE